MIYILFQDDYTEEEAALAVNKKMIVNTDTAFETRRRDHDLNYDRYFRDLLKAIDRCDVPMRNVARDLLTGETHSFDRISGGIKSLWLMHHYNKDYIFPSCYFGENCYKFVFNDGKDRDIYIYEDSGMFATDEIEECVGVFTNYKTKEVIDVKNGFDYTIANGY